MPNLSKSKDKMGVRITSLSSAPDKVRVHNSLTGTEIGDIQKIEFDPIEPGKPITAKITCTVNSLDMVVETQVDEVSKD